ncbi:MAG: hypothetical protein IPL22_17995 [Bacteroidetes bacterium]|nr:hypothetical protein [Bacteroidota bacterium]
MNSNPKGTTKEYLVDKFKYNKKNDTYTCPEGQTLTTFGTWHTKNGMIKYRIIIKSTGHRNVKIVR